MNNQKQIPKREKRANFVGNQIMEIKAATKRKPAYLKIAVTEDLAQKLMRDNFKSVSQDLDIVALYLTWEELVK